jgi:hypothetical protein
MNHDVNTSALAGSNTTTTDQETVNFEATLSPDEASSQPAHLDAPATTSVDGDPAHADQHHPLERYSLKGQSEAMAGALHDQVHVLPGLALRGQASMIYAAPNTGKTLLTLHLLNEGIANGDVDPNCTFYVNVDDNSSGLVEKVRLAEERGFHMLAEGHRGFRASKLLPIIENLTQTGLAGRSIIIVDTVKRFTDLMDKRTASSFTAIIRAFVLKGGTFIGLAHTNKNKGASGKSVYGGTSDLVDDLDCVYVIDEIESDEPGTKVVEFRNIKQRGNVAASLAFSYASQSEINYVERLLSVQLVDPADLASARQAADLRTDSEIVATVESCIGEGINVKMDLVKEVVDRLKIPKRAALAVIDKYTGTTLGTHLWTFAVKARGAKVFEVLTPAASDDNGVY